MSAAPLALRWHAGWVLVRGYAATVAPDGVVRTVVGDHRRQVELLVPDGDADARRLDRACQQALAERDAWLSVVTDDPGRTSDRVAEHGLQVIAGSECLMRVDLGEQAAPGLPPGLRLHEDAASDAVRWRVEDADGALAASGQASYRDGWCVPDRIGVEPAFRRRGLGGALMAAAAAAARSRGASYGLLVASPEGRLLYESLGWQRVADLVVGAQR